MAPRRYLPNLELPPYTYIPGLRPHPFSHPLGHRFGTDEPAPRPEDLHDPRSCRPFLLGLDLYNAGFYWEAHEMWEKLWHLAGRKGPLADFFKALIQLAVAGVKWRQGQPDSTHKHARRAEELFAQIEAPLGPRPWHLSLPFLKTIAQNWQKASTEPASNPGCLEKTLKIEMQWEED